MFKFWRKSRKTGAATLRDRMGIILKSKDEIEQMRVAGQLAADVLRMIAPHVQPGIRTHELDDICHRYITETQDAIPAPLNYRGFPKSICTSVNHVVCHGIPGDKVLKKGDPGLSGDDVREGLVTVLSVKVLEPQFEGQTKTKLGNSEVRGIVESLVNDKLGTWLDENPSSARRIIEKAVQAARAREAARKARDLVIRKSALESMTLPGKLADCQERSPERAERTAA